MVTRNGVAREVTVVSGKEATQSTFERVGDEQVRLPIGNLETTRVRARAHDGRMTIDVWLARDYGMLPVRIRIVDDKGEVLDQKAIELRLSPPESSVNDPAVAEQMIELRSEPLAAEYN
jgi:negative regulator of sigma E activity